MLKRRSCKDFGLQSQIDLALNLDSASQPVLSLESGNDDIDGALNECIQSIWYGEGHRLSSQ